MHKRIALLIQKMVDDSPYKHFKCKVTPKKTNGFWKLKLTFRSRNDAHSESLVKSLYYIGMVYGETLYIEDNNKVVLVS
jgi:hypothetical protein